MNAELLDNKYQIQQLLGQQKLAWFIEHNQPVLYTLMRKRTSYNPAVGDWEFSVVNGDGKQVQASAKLENCQDCHAGRKDYDFVFRSYGRVQ